MEFANVGAHCHYELCQQQTYLPFTCDDCKHQFCRFHRTQETHSCPKLAASKTTNNNNNKQNGQKGGVSLDSLDSLDSLESKESGDVAVVAVVAKKPFKCKKKGCKKREWTAIECENCGLNYCIMHRNPDDHKCDEVMGLMAKKRDNKDTGPHGNDIGLKRQSLIDKVLSSFKSNIDDNKENPNGMNEMTSQRTVLVK